MEEEEEPFKNCHEPNTQSTKESCVEETPNNEIVTDYTNIFTTDILFNTREELVSWAQQVAKQNYNVVVVRRSENGGSYRKGRVSLGCERGGDYRPFKPKKMWKPQVDVNESHKKQEKRASGTKKCGCPFMLKGKQTSLMGPWALSVEYGVHNHSITKYLHGHSYVGRLTSCEEELVLDLSAGCIPPKNILRTIQEKDPTNASTLKTIYNARTRHKMVERAGQSQLQYLMGKLKKQDYYFLDRRCPNTDTVKELFFAHPDGVKLLRAFPSVIMMDCTYKTNKYRMPLLEIVGVTSTDMTFSIACVFMEAEKEHDYIWACSTLRGLMDEEKLPYLIITDRELALMNAVQVTFPTSSHFLCRWHINKNVLANCKAEMKTDEKWKEFNSSWQMLIDAKNETEFQERVKMLVNNFKGYDAVKYVMENWILLYKEKFVTSWTNQIMHYGNTTTNRAESHHSALKRQLANSMGNFESCWEHIHTLYVASHTAIKASFEKSINVVQHRHKSVIFKHMRGMVSIHAMKLILDEVDRVSKSEGCIDASDCGCILRKTCGLPCAHELVEYVCEDKPIPLSHVDDFWKKLDMEESKKQESGIHDPEIIRRFVESQAEINSKFYASNDAERILIVKRMREVANPSTTPLLEPDAPIHTRGRPSKAAKSKAYTSTKRNPSNFEYVESKIDSCSHSPSVVYEVGQAVENAQFSNRPVHKLPVYRAPRKKALNGSLFMDKLPPHFISYISGTTDVDGDGHCGFECVAQLLNMEKRSWGRVRGDLHYELSSNLGLYASAFFNEKMVNKCLKKFNCYEITAPKKYWFTLPEMGHLVASHYDGALVTLLNAECLTFLPLRTAFSEGTVSKVICIAFVHNNHFIQVHLQEGHPLPPVVRQWYSAHLPVADSWLSHFQARIDAYKTSAESISVNQSPINLDE